MTTIGMGGARKEGAEDVRSLFLFLFVAALCARCVHRHWRSVIEGEDLGLAMAIF
jgi:bacterioferritin-associated ferredoxin